MQDSALAEGLEVEARRVLDLDPVGLDAPVPWCPGWSVADAVGHLSGVQRWATVLSNEPGTWIRRRDMEQPPTGPAVLEWYAAGVDPMLAAFDGTTLDQTVNTWAGEQPRRWWLRRLAHETAVHRWDAEAAAVGADRARLIDAALAVDGVDEVFENFLPRFEASAFAGRGQTLHLHATDAPGEWQLTFEPDGVRVERTHTKGDGAVRGPASELLLLLWNRRAPETTTAEVFGDPAVLGRWQSAVRV